MDDKAIREKAVAYSALTLFYDGDGEKAWSVLESLRADFSLSFASYTREFADSAEDEAKFNSIWRDVRSSFADSRIPFTVVEYSDAGNPVHFLYLAGKRELLDGRKLVFLGSVMPSLQGREDTALAVMEAVKNGYSILAPFEPGLGPYALSVALRQGGNAVAVLSNELSKCPSENLLPLMEEIYSRGLLVSQFPPCVKREKWHVVLRNRFLSSFGDAFYMAEEKDGGPGWAVFDAAMKNGRKCALSSSAVENPNFSWCSDRERKGALTIRKPREIKSLFTVPRKRKPKTEDTTGDLFGFSPDP